MSEPEIMESELRIYPQPPRFEIGDRLPNTDIYVRGVMTTSTGKHRYFLQISPDNSLVVDEVDLAPTLSVLTT